MTQTFKDQLGRSIELNGTPQRIVSLVPSQTELLHELGLDEEVVGLTKFCVHPEEWFRNKTRVGGTKQVKIAQVRALRPDLIIANQEENTPRDIKALQDIAPVWISDIRSIEDALDMIRSIGDITNRGEQGRKIADEIRSGFRELGSVERHQKVLYLIWKDPFMAAGRDTFIQSMLEAAGFENVITDPNSRYPEVSLTQIKQLNPDRLFLSSEPFPFKRKHTEELRETFPDITVEEVDGELFSWYGSRMIEAIKYFEHLQGQRAGSYLS